MASKTLECVVNGIRLDRSLYAEVQRFAESEARTRGESRANISAVVRRALVQYLAGNSPEARLTEARIAESAVNAKWLPH